MNIVPYAISNLKMAIPNYLLTETFLSSINRTGRYLNLDEVIEDTVIRPIVFKDINVITGQMALIPLAYADRVRIDPLTTVFNIDQDILQGRKIIAVHSVGLGFNTAVNLLPLQSSFNTNTSPCQNNPIANAQRAMDTANLDSYSPITTNCRLLAGDSLYVLFNAPTAAVNAARVTLTHDENLANINPMSYGAFSDLVLLATKAYIYNAMKVPLDQGYYINGVEISSLKEIVDSYSEAYTDYKTFLNTKWARVSFCNDKIQYSRYIKLQIPANF